MAPIQEQKEYHFIYRGVEYDASHYVDKHPGGITFLDNMKNSIKDMTEYFRALHSDSAQKILKSFPIVSIKQPSKSSQEYMALFRKVEPYFVPFWSIEILLFLLCLSMWMIGCMTKISVLSVLCFGLTQILNGWISHSAAHNRNRLLTKLGGYQSALLGGLSLCWWAPKHNMHHMFTNVQKYDEDIQHAYKVYLYPFLYLKWRFDSIVSAFTNQNYLDIGLILVNYLSLWFLGGNFINWLIGQLISGFYSAIVLIGNHQRETRYEQKPDVPFMDHQILTCRNYRQDNLFWLLLMGGMQYQTEHHLFPQIPFYRLPAARKIIKAELKNMGKSLIYGTVM